jgi:hypothetical protein
MDLQGDIDALVKGNGEVKNVGGKLIDLIVSQLKMLEPKE